MLHKLFFSNRTFAPILLLVSLLICSSDQHLLSQERSARIPYDEQQDRRQTRGYSRNSPENSKLEGQGKSRFLRWAIHDGNLVEGGVLNIGIISYAEVSNTPRIGWPKGTQWVSYLYGAHFYVAAEVEDIDGNTIHISSDHWTYGELSPNGTHRYAFQALPKYYNLDTPNSTEIPLIGGISEDLGIDGLPNSNDQGEGDGLLQPQEDQNLNGVLDVRMQNGVNWFAMSNRRETWPEYWPAGSYPGDDRSQGEERPGVRAMRWNGEFGAFIRADQESYYLMDDSENDEFNYYPFDDQRPWPKGRRGLGVTAKVRGYQWNARLSEDIYISLYDITNEGQDLEKVVVGMFADLAIGGTFSGDDAFFDELDDITYAWNKLFRAGNGLPIGYFGLAFLESPGLAEDGIDNDLDGLTDESQSNGIDDDGDWIAWEDENLNGLHDSEDLNFNGVLDPGEDSNGNGLLDIERLNSDVGADGLGPDFFEYTGPDEGEANGIPDNGEPNFEFTDNDESDQVGLTSWYLRRWESSAMSGDEQFWARELQPGNFEIVEGYAQDITFTYGSGFVRFAGEEKKHRYAIALLFGNNFEDILRNKRTMQVIYDNDYNFAKPPRQPRLSAMGDDGAVYLQWDTGAELSKDPIYGDDFEAYYVYRATDPAFNEIKTITDAFGNPLLFEPLAIYDLDNGLKGLHPVNIGSELGSDSDLGVTYNMGTDSGLEHRYIDTSVTNGRTYYYAVASVDRGYHPDFYPEISPLRDLQPISPTESPINIQTDLLGRPIVFDLNTVAVVPSERSGGWVEPALSAEGLQHLFGSGTGNLGIEVYSPLEVLSGNSYRIRFEDNAEFENIAAQLYAGPEYTGRLSKLVVESVNDNLIVATVIDPLNNSRFEEYIFDGLRVTVQNDSNRVDTLASAWTRGNSPLRVRDVNDNGIPAGFAVGRDYEVRVGEAGFDTTVTNQPKNFQVWDVTGADSEIKLRYTMIDADPRDSLSAGDRVSLIGSTPGNKVWEFDFYLPENSAGELPQPGDVLSVKTTKSFDRNDVFEFTILGNTFSGKVAASELDDIFTVPDPYIGVNSLERQVINEQEGRGDRQIDFVNLPQQCTITIFTVSGKIVRKLDYTSAESSKQNRRASWDLRTKDGLEIAHGMYFYHINAPGIGEKTGKFAVIK